MGISFEYPAGWGLRLYSNGPEGDDGCIFNTQEDGMVFIRLSIDRIRNPKAQFDDTTYADPEPGTGVEVVYIGGIKGYYYEDRGSEDSGGKFKKRLYACNGTVQIIGEFSTNPQLSEEDAQKVINRFLQTFDCDFSKW